jgi:hypothetical protein
MAPTRFTPIVGTFAPYGVQPAFYGSAGTSLITINYHFQITSYFPLLITFKKKNCSKYYSII